MSRFKQNNQTLEEPTALIYPQALRTRSYMTELMARIINSNRVADNLSLMVEAAHVLNSTIEYEELLKNVLKLVIRAVDAEAATVYRYDRKSQTLRGRFFAGSQEPSQTEFKIGQGFTGWVAEHCEPVLTNSPKDDPRYRADLAGPEDIELRSLICVPLNLRGDFFGVIEAVNKSNGGFDQDDLDSLDLLSDQIALAINNARLYMNVARQSLQRKTLFDVSRQLLSPLTLDELLKSVLSGLKKVVNYDAGGIYLIDEASGDVESINSVGYDKLLESDLRLKIGQGIVGHVARSGKPEIVGDVSADDRYINARPATKSEIVVPITSDEKLVGVLNLESDRLNRFSDEDCEIITAFASQAAISIERARMHRMVLDQKRLDEQLAIARTIQKTFLPKKVPSIKGYEIWGSNIPSEEVGGDYYDFIEIVENQIGIAIADVSGKGIPAALIMASFRASLIAEIRNNYAIRSICSKVNNLLCESLKPDNFVTAIYGVLDTKNSIFTFSNCGHNPGLLLRAGGTIEELTEGGILMGIKPQSKYEERPIYIAPGDILCLYTDGIIEAEDPKGEQYETGRLIAMIRDNVSLPARQIGQKIIKNVRAFAADDYPFDDLTLLIIKRLPASA